MLEPHCGVQGKNSTPCEGIIQSVQNEDRDVYFLYDKSKALSYLEEKKGVR